MIWYFYQTANRLSGFQTGVLGFRGKKFDFSVLKNCKLRSFLPPDALFRLGLRKFLVNGCQRQENSNSR